MNSEARSSGGRGWAHYLSLLTIDSLLAREDFGDDNDDEKEADANHSSSSNNKIYVIPPPPHSTNNTVPSCCLPHLAAYVDQLSGKPTRVGNTLLKKRRQARGGPLSPSPPPLSPSRPFPFPFFSSSSPIPPQKTPFFRSPHVVPSPSSYKSKDYKEEEAETEEGEKEEETGGGYACRTTPTLFSPMRRRRKEKRKERRMSSSKEKKQERKVHEGIPHHCSYPSRSGAGITTRSSSGRSSERNHNIKDNHKLLASMKPEVALSGSSLPDGGVSSSSHFLPPLFSLSLPLSCISPALSSQKGGHYLSETSGNAITTKRKEKKEEEEEARGGKTSLVRKKMNETRSSSIVATTMEKWSRNESRSEEKQLPLPPQKDHEKNNKKGRMRRRHEDKPVKGSVRIKTCGAGVEPTDSNKDDEHHYNNINNRSGSSTANNDSLHHKQEDHATEKEDSSYYFALYNGSLPPPPPCLPQKHLDCTSPRRTRAINCSISKDEDGGVGGEDTDVNEEERSGAPLPTLPRSSSPSPPPPLPPSYHHYPPSSSSPAPSHSFSPSSPSSLLPPHPLPLPRPRRASPSSTSSQEGGEGERERRCAGRAGEIMLGDFIAGGACGRVYRCYHTTMKTLLAGKELYFSKADPRLPAVIHQLAIELEVMFLSTRRSPAPAPSPPHHNRDHHANRCGGRRGGSVGDGGGIVEFFCAEKRGHTVWIFMEYCERGSLLDYCLEKKKKSKKGNKETTPSQRRRIVMTKLEEGKADQEEEREEIKEEHHLLCSRAPPGLPLREIQRFTAQITSALAFLHSRGYAHLDIKSANIFLTTRYYGAPWSRISTNSARDHHHHCTHNSVPTARRGNSNAEKSDGCSKTRHSPPLFIRLGDFGCAARLQRVTPLPTPISPTPTSSPSSSDAGSHPPHHHHHQSGGGRKAYSSIIDPDEPLDVLRGTPLYMAPEVIRLERDKVGTASDVWSLGCLVMELATGEPPWKHWSAESLRVLYLLGSTPSHAVLPLPPPALMARLQRLEQHQQQQEEGEVEERSSFHTTTTPSSLAGLKSSKVVASLRGQLSRPIRRQKGRRGILKDKRKEKKIANEEEKKESHGGVDCTSISSVREGMERKRRRDGLEDSMKNREMKEGEEEYTLMKELIDFLSQCLQVRPEDRPSANALLQHSFLQTRP